MTSAADRPARSSLAPSTPACVRLAAVFLDPLLEQPPLGSAPSSVRRRFAELSRQARAACTECPLLADCLYRAVVVYDVAGFVAGTTERQRAEIRRRLGIRVAPEDFDTLAGVSGGHRPVDHGEVVRLRRAHPEESLEKLAHRLGCSLSTVKRHLRRERRSPSTAGSAAVRPSPRAVMIEAGVVLGHRPERLTRSERSAAA